MDRTYKECEDILLTFFNELFSYSFKGNKEMFIIKKLFYRRYLKNKRRFNKLVMKNYKFNLIQGWII